VLDARHIEKYFGSQTLIDKLMEGIRLICAVDVSITVNARSTLVW
jgi:hypothetical protein